MKDSKDQIDKRALIEQWLSAYQSVVVFVNSKAKGLIAPASQLHKPSFSLALSHFFDRPLIVKNEYIEAQLLFDNTFCQCLMPWHSIWAAYPEEFSSLLHFWNEDSPGSGWDQALKDYLKLDSNKMEADRHKQELPKPKLSLVQDLGKHIVEVALKSKQDLESEDSTDSQQTVKDPVVSEPQLTPKTGTPKANKKKAPVLKLVKKIE